MGLEEELAELRNTYVQSLDGKFSTIKSELVKCLESLKMASKPDYAQLIFLVHKVAGSSGTYGFKGLGLLCSYLEDTLLSKTSFTKLSSDEQRAVFLNQWINEFKTAIEKIKQDPARAFNDGAQNAEAMSKTIDRFNETFFNTKRSAA